VQSVLDQTVRPKEIILVDDASGDETARELKRLATAYPEMIKVISFDVNKGVSDARNSGWDAATQPYIAFLDADDAWHPEKIETQYGYMTTHPDVVLSGHNHRQINPEYGKPSWRLDRCKIEHVTKSSILISNRFITPSVMLKRDIPFRFATGKRHMEDHLLWSQIVCAGSPVIKLSVKLAAIYKYAYGAAGLSAQSRQMYLGEVSNFHSLRNDGYISTFSMLALLILSYIKNCRRKLVVLSRKLTGLTAWQVASFMMLTYSISGLLALLGAFGRHEVAADVAIVQGAALATFYMLSGDARHLILAERVQAKHVIFFRLIWVVPLALIAYFMSTGFGHADPTIACLLIVRRAMEWLAEVHVTEIEREGLIWRGLLFQPLLLVLTAVQLMFFHGHEWGWVWALSPILLSVKFLTTASYYRSNLFENAHIGSTAVMGLSNYALRILIVSLAGKVFAGMLFSAIVIGSFTGTMFATVLGPTLVRKNLFGSAYLRMGLGLWALSGFVTFLLADAMFYKTVGLSIIGGALMALAQHSRLLLLKSQHTFREDALIHVLLLGCAPFVYYLAGVQWLTAIYLINAMLAWTFYRVRKNNEV
jgi:glycosyltransferase involved in cell wall biosynthesis